MPHESKTRHGFVGMQKKQAAKGNMVTPLQILKSRQMLKSVMNLDRSNKIGGLAQRNVAPEDIKDEKNLNKNINLKDDKKNVGNLMDSILKQHTMQLKQTKFADERASERSCQQNASAADTKFALRSLSVHDSIHVIPRESLKSYATPNEQKGKRPNNHKIDQ